MQRNYQQQTLLAMPKRRVSSTVEQPSYTSLPVKSDAEAIAQAIWLTSESEAPLPEAWSVPDLFHHTEGSVGEYHSDLVNPTSQTGASLLQWMQEHNHTIPTSLAGASTDTAIYAANSSSAADERLLAPTTSSSSLIPSYYPASISSGTHEYISGSSSSHNALVQVPATTALLDLNTSYLLSPSPITTTPLAYPATTTATSQYHTLFTATTTAPSLEPNQPSTAFAAPHSVLPGYLDAPFGIANQYVLPTQNDHENEHLIDDDDNENYADIPSIPNRSKQQEASSSSNTKKLNKKSTGSISKASTGKKKAKDSISLLPKSAKLGLISRQTSCWRCRRYKKPCSGKGSVCDACVTSGFRIWSSEIGCRKGGMDEFILMLIPSEADSHPIVIDSPYTKPPSFRQSVQMFPSDTVIPLSAARGDVWDQFLFKIQSTGIHGPGVLELVQIAIDFQRKLKKPDKVIVSAARSMSAAADMFRIFVATEDSKTFHTATNITNILWETRKVLVAAAAQFLRNCLTGRIKQWFPTFMASNMNVFAYILIGDAIAAIPVEHRNAIWPNVRKTLMDLRSVLYPTARDLMNALSKGSQPLNMSCWGMVQEDNGTGMVRNPDGMQLVDDCEVTFDAIRELQLWRDRFWHLLYGDSWMSTRPLEVDLLLITSVSRLFITPKA